MTTIKRCNGSVIYNATAENVADAIKEATAKNTNLQNADLQYADLQYANLRYADLRNADLQYADLQYADLQYADLRNANLRNANLQGASLQNASLQNASLQYADLRYANLRYADLRNANLPSPTMLLLASWGAVSDELCADLMLFNAANHPDPTAFDRWASGGLCPYDDVKIQRAANFQEKTHLWGKGSVCRPYDLAMRLIAEKCKGH